MLSIPNKWRRKKNCKYFYLSHASVQRYTLNGRNLHKSRSTTNKILNTSSAKSLSERFIYYELSNSSVQL